MLTQTTQQSGNAGMSRVAIIGAGSVGSTIAYAIMMRNLRVEILLADKATEFCEGQVRDLEDSSFLSNTRISHVGLPEAGQADIIVVTAGAKQRPGESRDELVGRNKAILTSIVEEMGPINRQAIWMMVANPVDLLTALAQKLTGLPAHQVLGSGTFLDSARLRKCIAKRLNINPSSVHCQVLGEHGDRQVVAWSLGTIYGGMPLLNHKLMRDLTQADLDAISHGVARRAYDIIELKGSTHFGIGACVAVLCDAILSNSYSVYPISCYHPVHKVYLSYPAVLSRRGIEEIDLNLPLNKEEEARLALVVKSMKEVEL